MPRKPKSKAPKSRNQLMAKIERLEKLITSMDKKISYSGTASKDTMERMFGPGSSAEQLPAPSAETMAAERATMAHHAANRQAGADETVRQLNIAEQAQARINELAMQAQPAQPNMMDFSDAPLEVRGAPSADFSGTPLEVSGSPRADFSDTPLNVTAAMPAPAGALPDAVGQFRQAADTSGMVPQGAPVADEPGMEAAIGGPQPVQLPPAEAARKAYQEMMLEKYLAQMREGTKTNILD